MKKDLKPIWLYLALFFGIQFVIGFVLGIIYLDNAMEVFNNLSGIITFSIYLIIAITFVCIYKNNLKVKIKKMTKQDYVYSIVGAVILILVNIVLYRLFVNMNVELGNQEAVLEAYESSKILMLISVVFLGPFVEEMVFRYSLSTFIKNNYVFVIVSSLMFGLMHGVGVATILYTLLGIILSLTYLKTNKNVIASIIAHILNNAFAMITIMIMIRF